MGTVLIMSEGLRYPGLLLKPHSVKTEQPIDFFTCFDGSSVSQELEEDRKGVATVELVLTD